MRVIHNRHFALILALFVFCSVLHYVELIGIIDTTEPSFHFGLTRHTLDRILFLLPIIYSAYIFKLNGGLGISFAALLVMLPRATLISPAPADAILETVGVIMVGTLVSLWSWTLARAKAREITKEKQMQDNLRYYLQGITRAQEEERKRIARELHDDTAQALYALTRQVDTFVRTNTNLPADNVAFLGDLGKQINKVLQDLRRFSQDLRPPMLDDLGLLATLRWVSSEVRERCGVEVNLEVAGVERRLPPEVEFTLFRIIQEALRNIEKHAGTLKAEVELEFGENKTRVSVSDNGKGFQLSGNLANLVRTGRLGLAGMEERARLLNGSIRIESEPGKGTIVMVEIPI